MNLYAYVANRPMMFRDPSGRLSESQSNLGDGYYDLGGTTFGGLVDDLGNAAGYSTAALFAVGGANISLYGTQVDSILALQNPGIFQTVSTVGKDSRFILSVSDNAKILAKKILPYNSVVSIANALDQSNQGVDPLRIGFDVSYAASVDLLLPIFPYGTAVGTGLLAIGPEPFYDAYQRLSNGPHYFLQQPSIR